MANSHMFVFFGYYMVTYGFIWLLLDLYCLYSPVLSTVCCPIWSCLFPYGSKWSSRSMCSVISNEKQYGLLRFKMVSFSSICSSLDHFVLYESVMFYMFQCRFQEIKFKKVINTVKIRYIYLLQLHSSTCFACFFLSKLSQWDLGFHPHNFQLLFSHWWRWKMSQIVLFCI